MIIFSKNSLRMIQVWLGVVTLSLLPNSCSKKQDVEEEVEEEAAGQEEETAENKEATSDEQVNDAATDLAASEKEVPEQLTEDASANPAAGGAVPQAAPAPQALGNGTVMYVRSNGTKLLSEASSGGATVATLDKGDHILVEVQGEWARTVNNTYIAMKDLSTDAVGRKRGKNPWRSR